MITKEGGSEFSTLYKYVYTVVAIWSVTLSLSLIWNVHLERKLTRNLAVADARTTFNKDSAIRYWAASHGGVYVPVNERTPPNPNLLTIPERDITTPLGKELTLMNPAYMLRQLMAEFGEKYGRKGRMTSLKPLRPDNKPDEWEKKGLLAFEEGSKEIIEFTQIDGEPYLRLMRPVMVAENCLKCHDFQGYKIGDVRGGVSIAVPLKSLEAEQKRHIFIMIMSHMIIWGIGCVGIWSGTRRLRKGIHEQNITTKTVKESLAQKEALNKELHHRVKNNMQLIISLLNLQASEIEEPELANKFIVAKNRINSMALIHELLYDEKDITRINMEPYIQRLVLDLFESLNIYTESISAIVDMPDISFPIEMATPCGLLVNELVSNSLKHAFLDNKKGEIVISIHSLQENKYELTVSDNGRGIPENIDIKNPATFGLILVNTLISQLEGEVTIGLSRGTVFKILFNETKSKAMKL